MARWRKSTPPEFFRFLKNAFPGIKINHVDATSDKLVARAVTEARGGKTLGDVLQVPLENVVQAHDQSLLLETTLPESADYAAGIEGTVLDCVRSAVHSSRHGTRTLVKKEEEPKQFDDFADPRWKNRLIAEPRDLEMLLGFRQVQVSRAMRKRSISGKRSPPTTSSFIKAIRNWRSYSSPGKQRFV